MGDLALSLCRGGLSEQGDGSVGSLRGLNPIRSEQVDAARNPVFAGDDLGAIGGSTLAARSTGVGGRSCSMSAAFLYCHSRAC
jgi:hypothetical protein